MSAKSGNHKDPSDLLGPASEALSGAVGHEYFRRLTSYLCNDLGMEFAFIGELVPGSRNTIRTLSLVPKAHLRKTLSILWRALPANMSFARAGDVSSRPTSGMSFPKTNSCKTWARRVMSVPP